MYKWNTILQHKFKFSIVQYKIIQCKVLQSYRERKKTALDFIQGGGDREEGRHAWKNTAGEKSRHFKDWKSDSGSNGNPNSDRDAALSLEEFGVLPIPPNNIYVRKKANK